MGLHLDAIGIGRMQPLRHMQFHVGESQSSTRSAPQPGAQPDRVRTIAETMEWQKRRNPEEIAWQLSQMSLQHADGDIIGGPYPERPGEPNCVYYIRTGQCGYGTSCRFAHPPDRTLGGRGGADLPERPGQEDCGYYLKTGQCKFGPSCRYNHPKDRAGSQGKVALSPLGLPLRPEEKECAYYLRTGTCKYGVTCKYNHPVPPNFPDTANMSFPSLGVVNSDSQTNQNQAFPQMHQSGGPTGAPPMSWNPRGGYSLPGGYPQMRLIGPSPPLLPLGQGVYTPYPNPIPRPIDGLQQPQLPFMFNPLQNTQGDQSIQPLGLPDGYMHYMQPGAFGAQGERKDVQYPERPGQPECQYYMKTGECKFGATCRFHHPKDRATPSPTCVLSPMGLPLRPGAPACAFYNRYGICKFGHTCRFDHPVHDHLSYSPSASSLADMPVVPFPANATRPTRASSLDGRHPRVDEELGTGDIPTGDDKAAMAAAGGGAEALTE